MNNNTFSVNAHDLFVIATRMAGFDATELILEIHCHSPNSKRINEPMVSNAMERICERNMEYQTCSIDEEFPNWERDTS